jgi:cobalamin synthase
MGRFFGNALVCCIFSLFPLIFGIAVIRSYATRVGGISGDPGGFAEALLFPLIGLCWPAILVYRVLRLRSQSIRNRQDEQVVRW